MESQPSVSAVSLRVPADRAGTVRPVTDYCSARKVPGLSLRPLRKESPDNLSKTVHKHLLAMPPRLGKGARGKTAPPIPKAVAEAKAAAAAAAAGSSKKDAASTTTSKATATAAASRASKGGAASGGNQQLLDPKDAALLAQVFQQYEEKKYAASVKTADLILKKAPNHAREWCCVQRGA